VQQVVAHRAAAPFHDAVHETARELILLTS